MTFFFFQEKSTVRALCAIVSAVPVPTRLGSSPLSKQTGPAGGGWKLEDTDLRSSDRWVGSRPRSSAHCPWCRQRWQRRNGGPGGHRSGGGTTGQGPGTRTGMLHRVWAPLQGRPGETARPAHAGARAAGDGSPYLGNRRARKRSAAARSLPAFFGGP